MKFVIAHKNVNGIEVGLVHWTTNRCTPFVVAWNMPLENVVETENGKEFVGSWGQGHYFAFIDNAVECYNEY